MKAIVVTWGRSITRSKSLSDRLEAADFHACPKFMSKKLNFLNYILASIETLKILLKERPLQVVAVAPPVFTVVIVWIYKIIFERKLILFVDLHNGVLRKEWRHWPLFKLIMKSCIVLSHNEVVRKRIDEVFGIKSYVLSDPLPRWGNLENCLKSKSNELNVFVPFSFALDEPYAELLEASRDLPDSVNLIVSGDYGKRYPTAAKEFPDVNFIGYVTDREYRDFVFSCDVILCLTTGEDIQMCALVEAIALNKFVIASSTKVNREIFSDYIEIFCDNNNKSISNTVSSVKVEASRGFRKDLRSQYNEFWLNDFHKIFKDRL